MWLLITLLLTCSLHEVAESSILKYRKDCTTDPVNESKQKGDQCLTEGSNGNGYRGTVSKTSKGSRCLYWDRIHHIGMKAISQGLGSHNYCRNPDNRSGPWCWVRQRTRKVREFCNIPRCETNHDTEMTCGESNPKQRNFKVIGGLRASIESQPWLASIFTDKTFVCGGTLISPCWVLTAAHCFISVKGTKKDKFSVYLGKDATNQTDLRKEQMFQVAELVLHHDFDELSFDNDIALLRIADKNGECAKKTSSVRTACLPPAQHMMPYGSFCHIAGYGHEKNDDIPGTFRYSRYMKEAQVQVLSPTICGRSRYYGNKVTENQFCAASPTWTEDACQGDSGGPLLCEANGRMFLFGIISWGEGCATKFKPGVYTKVTNYNNWISKQTGLLGFTKGSMYPRKA